MEPPCDEATVKKMREGLEKAKAVKTKLFGLRVSFREGVEAVEELIDVHSDVQKDLQEALDLATAIPKSPSSSCLRMGVLAAVGLIVSVGIATAPDLEVKKEARMASNMNYVEFNEGMKAMRSRDYVLAISHFTKSYEDKLDPELCLGQMAECQFYLGRFEEALATCNKLTVEKANSGRAAYIRGLVYLKQGKKDLARTELQWASRRGEYLASTVDVGG